MPTHRLPDPGEPTFITSDPSPGSELGVPLVRTFEDALTPRPGSEWSKPNVIQPHRRGNKPPPNLVRTSTVTRVSPPPGTRVPPPAGAPTAWPSTPLSSRSTPPPAAQAHARATSFEPSVGRSTLLTSIGSTLARILGFARNSALAAAIGSSAVADSYNVANNLPNMLFYLLGGGTIAAVFVPNIVRHANRSQRLADQYGTVLIAFGAVAGVVVSGVLVALNHPLFQVLGGSAWTGSQRQLAVSLSFWCLPQVLFFVLVMLLTQLLNARGKFWAASWTPALNSIVVITNSLIIAHISIVSATDPTSVSRLDIILLGSGTLGGSVLQMIILWISLRRVGFRMSWPTSMRGLGLRSTARTATWTFMAAATSQVCNLLVSSVATRAGARAQAQGFIGRGYSSYFFAQTIVISVQTVGTAGLAMILLQRLSKLTAAGDEQGARAETETVVLRAFAIATVLTGLLLVLSRPAITILFDHGHTRARAVSVIITLFVIMCTGLIPYSLQPILLRPFYARGDAATPFRGFLLIYGVYGTATLVAAFTVPDKNVVFAAAIAFSAAYWVDLPMKLRRLHRSGLFTPSARTRRLVMRSALATLISSAAGYAAVYAVLRLHLHAQTGAGLGLLAGLAVFIVVYEPLTFRSSISLLSIGKWMLK